MSIDVLGIDLGKNVCSLVGLDKAGAVVMRRRLRRDGVVEFVGKLPACIVAMEACCGAHHLGRELEAAGHTIHLMSPEYVRPCGKANKNDDRDAEAIAEAATRPTMRFVPVKSEVQSDIQALHRARSRLVAERTALINHLRALLLGRTLAAHPHQQSDRERVCDRQAPHDPNQRLPFAWHGADDGLQVGDDGVQNLAAPIRQQSVAQTD